MTTAVYKPIRGERPLDDFPDGTLAYREVAAYAVSEAAGWGIVPPTVLRAGPFGLGMLQQWIDVDETVDVIGMVVGDDPRLRPMAVFDAAVNNTDRKAGHILPVPGGHLYGVDHGVCFSAGAEAPDGPVGLARRAARPRRRSRCSRGCGPAWTPSCRPSWSAPPPGRDRRDPPPDRAAAVDRPLPAPRPAPAGHPVAARLS